MTLPKPSSSWKISSGLVSEVKPKGPAPHRAKITCRACGVLGHNAGNKLCPAKGTR